MKIGIAQLTSTDEVSKNLEQITRIISDAEDEKPEIIFFPENSLFFRIDVNSSVQAVKLDDEIIHKLEDLCSDVQISAHLTTPVIENGKIYNASILIDKRAGAKIVYRKIHLFDIELKGQRAIRESDSFAPGAAPAVFEMGGLKFGSSICYDIRFAELYSTYAKQEVDVILVPAAFLVKTGMAHWEVLLRARAIESQCFLVAPAQAGRHMSFSVPEAYRETYGHSLVVDPWGRVSGQKQDGVGAFFTHLHKSDILEVRGQIPMSGHRRIGF